MTWRILRSWPWLLVLLPLPFVVATCLSVRGVVHDKAANADGLARLQQAEDSLPLGVIVPAHNRWSRFAFVADSANRADGQGPAILILDDHYRGGDPSFRSESGLIGDPPGAKLLCSIPGEAAAKGVALDTMVRRFIEARCGRAD